MQRVRSDSISSAFSPNIAGPAHITAVPNNSTSGSPASQASLEALIATAFITKSSSGLSIIKGDDSDSVRLPPSQMDIRRWGVRFEESPKSTLAPIISPDPQINLLNMNASPEIINECQTHATLGSNYFPRYYQTNPDRVKQDEQWLEYVGLFQEPSMESPVFDF